MKKITFEEFVVRNNIIVNCFDDLVEIIRVNPGKGFCDILYKDCITQHYLIRNLVEEIVMEERRAVSNPEALKDWVGWGTDIVEECANNNNFMIVVCKLKFRDNRGNIIGYRLKDMNNNTIDILPDSLKKAIKSGRIQVQNLRLTSDDRLVSRNNL